MGHMGTHAVSVSLYPNLAYKPDVDFEPIGVVIEVPIVLVARKNFPANDLKEFMVYVRANAAKLNMARAGVGSNGWLSTSRLPRHSAWKCRRRFLPAPTR
jgi:tripartite-type tricarboxylate transporter receptor subunit TctC